ncbi:MAG: SAM-dependent chlorinase/fluorinase [Anaerolineales bacterium]|nr:SAM-dependent chlorinase/fluorinase [Anaerolineales bacterium]
MPVLTITTDFGNKDGFVGTMKGVIWGICPQVQIADISHEISPQNILEGAHTLWRAVPYFPPGTVHVAVIDPGVGASRRALAARIGEQYFVAPDNGLLTPFLEAAEEDDILIVHANNPKYWRQEISATFHGRDIFAPAGAYIANGVPLSELGDFIEDPIWIELPEPEATKNGWVAHVVAVDIFGNLATDLPAARLDAKKEITFRISDRVIKGLVPSYGHRQPGDLVALIDSEGYLEVAVVNGSAARTLAAMIGDWVEIVYE